MTSISLHPSTRLQAWISRSRLAALLPGLLLMLAFIAFLALVQFASPDLPDNDGYYHIKLAYLMRTEGLIPALESTHAYVRAVREAPSMRRDEVILINQSGRGDKDIFPVADAIGDEKWKRFITGKAAQYASE